MDPKILDELAKSNPSLIAKYRARMHNADDAYETDKKTQEMVGYANVLGKALTDYNNSQKNDVVLRNRIQSLGARPSILEAEKSVYDDSSNKMAADAVASSEAEQKKTFDDYKQGRAIASDAQAIQSSERMRDPNSKESQNARAYIKQFSPNYPGLEGMSAAEIEAYAPGIMKKYQIDQEMGLKKSLANQKAVPTVKDEMDLAKNYRDHPVTKATNEVATSFEKVKSAAKNPSAAGDLSLIFAYMKMLDPGSTVREGEFATAQNAAGIPTQTINMYNRALNGERLAPEQREDFIRQSRNIYNAQIGRQAEIHKEFSDTAAAYGLNPGRAFGSAPKAKAAEKTGNGNAGRIVNVNGVDYKVGDDGDTLIPLK